MKDAAEYEQRRIAARARRVWALVLSILPALIGPFLIPVTLDTLF